MSSHILIHLGSRSPSRCFRFSCGDIYWGKRIIASGWSLTKGILIILLPHCASHCVDWHSVHTQCGFETFTDTIFTVNYGWPSLCSLITFTNLRLQQHDWSKTKKKWTTPFTQHWARLLSDCRYKYKFWRVRRHISYLMVSYLSRSRLLGLVGGQWPHGRRGGVWGRVVEPQRGAQVLQEAGQAGGQETGRHLWWGEEQDQLTQ